MLTLLCSEAHAYSILPDEKPWDISVEEWGAAMII